MNWSNRGFRDPGQSANWRGAAAGMTENYLQGHSVPDPVSRERTLGALGANVTLTGRIDRLDEHPTEDELVVVDYKTGRRVPTDDDARSSRALALYALMVQRSLRRAAFEVQLHHVPTGTIASYRHSPESLGRQLDRADAIGRDIAAEECAGSAGDYPPSIGPLCSWCDFKERCPEAATLPARSRWAGLPEGAEDGADTFPT
jgi:RecB family exonuclease